MSSAHCALASDGGVVGTSADNAGIAEGGVIVTSDESVRSRIGVSGANGSFARCNQVLIAKTDGATGRGDRVGRPVNSNGAAGCNGTGSGNITVIVDFEAQVGTRSVV